MGKSADKQKRAKPTKASRAMTIKIDAGKTDGGKLGRGKPGRAKVAKTDRGKATRTDGGKLARGKPGRDKLGRDKLDRDKPGRGKPAKRLKPKQLIVALPPSLAHRPPPPLSLGPAAVVLDRLWSVIVSRRDADPAVSHSARLLSRGNAKVAQKFGEEAVECLIEAVAGNREAVIAESADVLYHLMVLWVSAGVSPDEVWAELKRREGVSGIAEKASRATQLPIAFGLETTKIP
jgi:phosphoribosyl-ATP pyrophosphohydrolase